MQDPYKTLGVAKGATQAEIKNVYRALAKKLHPDLNPGNKKAEHDFKEINGAYEILGTPENRAKFDRGEWAAQGGESASGAAGARRGPFYREAPGGERYNFDFGEGFDESIFEGLFGGARARGGFRQPAQEVYQMEVEFGELIRGAEREIHLPSGKRLAVKIPKNSRPGQKLRFKGAQTVGQNASGGDIFVELQAKPDPRFTSDGANLVHELAVPLAIAILGGEIPVPTPEGQIMLKIPPNAGRRFRIPGKGTFIKGAPMRGDLFLDMRVVLPEKRDPALEAAIRGWIDNTEKKERSAS